jgi:DNA repair protein RecN (Recombination protein N)
MLVELKVQNFAIIQKLHVHFQKGLNILSGETGTGKSILLKSLALLMGAKSSSDMIRSQSTSASVEGLFDLSDRKDITLKLQSLDIPCDEDQLIVRRIISEDKSKVYLNGTLSSLQDLKDLVAPLIEVATDQAPLIEMTGQHENRNLQSVQYHLDMLDIFCCHLDLRNEFSIQFFECQKLVKEIEKIKSETAHKSQRLDFLKFQRDEIKSAEISKLDPLQLETELKKQKHSTKISQFVDSAEGALYTDDDSVISRIQTVIQKSAEVSHIDQTISEKISNLHQAKQLVEDCIYDLRQYISKIESNPSELERLESQLSALRKLQKKYGLSQAEILEQLQKIELEIADLENSDHKIEALETEFAKKQTWLKQQALSLHKQRQSNSKKLCQLINEELKDLNMKGVVFDISLKHQEQITQNGNSLIEFMIKNSTDDESRPLAKYASGGELSRVLLSLKKVVGSSKYPRTYLFDEVDTGVSGQTAEKVGKKLKEIAKGQQVICVTHLPQVAAFADSHYAIQKNSNNKESLMEVLELTSKQRVTEIARLISGEKITKTSLAHAEQLLNESRH